MRPITSPNGTPASNFSFGTMQFGGKSSESESEAVFRQSREAGINFFDTAHAYNAGRSEELLGRFVAGARDDLVIATKCGGDGDCSRTTILQQFDDSRKRLGMDQVDIYYLHRWDSATPLEETYEKMAELVSSGGIRMIGVSNYSAWQTMKAQAVAEKLGVSISILHPMYNLVKRHVEVEILPMARSEGFHVSPYSPLGGGLLTGKYLQGAEGRIRADKMYAARYAPGWMSDVAAGLGEIAAELDVSPITLAVAWVARNPDISMPIISGRTPEQLAPSLAAMAFDLDDATSARLSALSPTPAPATDRLEEA